MTAPRPIDTGSDHVLASVADRVATIALNRPERRNALAPETLLALEVALDRVERDDAVRAVVLTGAGGAYCSGGDVKGMRCILIDDIVDSGGTLVNAAEALLKHGAVEVMAYITHGVLSGGAVSRIQASKLKSLVITDSIQPTAAVLAAKNIRVLSIAPLIGEAILRTAREESVSSLFY